MFIVGRPPISLCSPNEASGLIVPCSFTCSFVLAWLAIESDRLLFSKDIKILLLANIDLS